MGPSERDVCGQWYHDDNGNLSDRLIVLVVCEIEVVLQEEREQQLLLQ